MKPYLLILLTLCTLGCDKTDPDPTPSYTPGYYFYCKVDGEEFRPEFKSELGYKNIKAKLLRDSSFFANADIGEQRVSFGLFNNDLIREGSYLLLKNGAPPGTASYTPTISIDKYNTDSTHTGQVEISRLDKNKKIVTGTFYFDA